MLSDKCDFIMKQRIYTLLVIFFLIILPNFAIDIHVPAMPIIVKQLHISVSNVQLTIGIFLLAYGTFPLLFGTLSDRYGRRSIALYAVLTLIIGSVICAAATSSGLLLFGRFIQGVGAGGCMPLARAVMRDSYVAEGMARVASLMGIAIELTLASSPVIGGYLVTYFGWHSNFLFVVALGMLIFFFIIYLFKETSQHHHNSLLTFNNFINNSKAILKNKIFMRYVWCNATAFCCAMSYFTISPFVIQTKLHYSAKAYGLITLCVTGAVVLGSLINAYFVKKVGSIKMIYFGLSLIVITGASLLIISLIISINLVAFVGLSTLVFFGLAFLFGNCMAGALTPFSQSAGSAGSFYSFLVITSSFFIALLISLLNDYNSLLLSLIYFITSSLSLWNFYRLRD